LFKRICWDHTEGEHFTIPEIMLYADERLFPQYKGRTASYKARSLGKIFSAISSKQYAGFKLVRQGIKRPAIYKLQDMRVAAKKATKKVVKKTASVSTAPAPTAVRLDNSFKRAVWITLIEEGFSYAAARDLAEKAFYLACAFDQLQES
jgi:hypothetical protein